MTYADGSVRPTVAVVMRSLALPLSLFRIIILYRELLERYGACIFRRHPTRKVSSCAVVVERFLM